MVGDSPRAPPSSGETRPRGRPSPTLRTPITAFGLAFGLAGAAFAIVTLLTGAPGWSVAVLTIAWSSVDVAGCLFYYRYFIPDRLEAAGDVILVETRLGGRRELASSELTFRLYRWNQFGGSFAWSSRARPRRSHAVFLTEAQVEYLADALDQARGTP